MDRTEIRDPCMLTLTLPGSGRESFKSRTVSSCLYSFHLSIYVIDVLRAQTPRDRTDVGPDIQPVGTCEPFRVQEHPLSFQTPRFFLPLSVGFYSLMAGIRPTSFPPTP